MALVAILVPAAVVSAPPAIPATDTLRICNVPDTKLSEGLARLSSQGLRDVMFRALSSNSAKSLNLAIYGSGNAGIYFHRWYIWVKYNRDSKN